jgi:Na+/phosphate symporter
MTLENCLENRRWAQSMFEENEQDKAKGLISHSTYVNRYWYLKTWIEKFDRCMDNFTCWHERHSVYQTGFEHLKKIAARL